MARIFSNNLFAALPVLTVVLSGSTGAFANPILMDGDFETPALGSGLYQYAGNCLVSECSPVSIIGYGWTFAPQGDSGGIASGSGIINATSLSAWFPFPSPIPSGFQGDQFGFVQGNAAMSQTFTAPVTGLYDLTWLEGGRPAACQGCFDGNQTYQVSIGSMDFGPYSTLSGQNFEQETSGLFSLTGGDSYTLTFLGLATSGDHTSFIDAVSLDLVDATPLPAALPLFATGLGALGLLGWRRKGRTQAAA